MRRLALRRWQMEALDAFEASPKRDFLAVATPGAGKTTFALTAALRDLARHPHRRVVDVTPTQHLKHQWSEAAATFGLHLESAWSSTEPFPPDMHGVVVTYQQVAAAPKALRAPSDDGFVVLDELHHAGTERAWGDGVAWAFAPAARRLALSGTPFRSDTSPIPFVTYGPTEDQPWVEQDEAVADHVYGYGDALRDGAVVRPVFFPRLGGQMEWTAPDGTEMAATFDDDLDRTGASQRLRTALSADGEWLPTVLDQAHEQLLRLCAQQPDAGALAITIDREHAQAVARLLRQRHGVRPVVVTADEADASERISAFATSREPWIVAVRMVSEGVDIPRLRVGVYATTTVTELFFRQAVGRLVRWQAGQRRQKAFMFLPDDPRLRTYAVQLAESRTHSLKRREQDGDQVSVELDQLEQRHAREDQLSLFQAISATPLDGVGGVFDDAHPEDLIVDEGAGLTLEIELAAPPPLAGAGELARTLTVSRTQRKREVRQANSDRVRMLTHLTGLTPEVINARLNQEVGLASIAEASLAQLERRRQLADRWIDRV